MTINSLIVIALGLFAGTQSLAQSPIEEYFRTEAFTSNGPEALALVSITPIVFLRSPICDELTLSLEQREKIQKVARTISKRRDVPLILPKGTNDQAVLDRLLQIHEAKIKSENEFLRTQFAPKKISEILDQEQEKRFLQLWRWHYLDRVKGGTFGLADRRLIVELGLEETQIQAYRELMTELTTEARSNLKRIDFDVHKFINKKLSERQQIVYSSIRDVGSQFESDKEIVAEIGGFLNRQSTNLGRSNRQLAEFRQLAGELREARRDAKDKRIATKKFMLENQSRLRDSIDSETFAWLKRTILKFELSSLVARTSIYKRGFGSEQRFEIPLQLEYELKLSNQQQSEIVKLIGSEINRIDELRSREYHAVIEGLRNSLSRKQQKTWLALLGEPPIETFGSSGTRN